MSAADIHSRPMTWATIGRSLVYTVLFNTAITLLLMNMGFQASFLQTFIFSQCIGLTICSFVMTIAYHLFRGSGVVMRTVLIGLAIAIGAIGGTLIGSAAAGIEIREWRIDNHKIWQHIGTAMIFGLIIAPFFYNRKRLVDITAMAQEERLRRLSSEKLAIEADLKRLQAQIEPHFLFNTLSNILSLMDSDIEKAKSMQLDLIRYLRTSLGRSRNHETTLGQEIESIRAYLDIFKIRMGSRLVYEIDVPDSLLDRPLPPMLLQPLVENAVIHGLESKIEGGGIVIRATVDGELLKIEIADTGLGFSPHHSLGVGLTNVKKRLAQLYGDQGRLILEENNPGGMIVRIEIPMSESLRTAAGVPKN